MTTFVSGVLTKEVHSADGKTYLTGYEGNWEIFFLGRYIASFDTREEARQALRALKRGRYCHCIK